MVTRSISRLRLSTFRNYASAALDLDPRHVVLVGPNGAGKTNILEALSLLSPGRGLRRAPFEDLAQAGGEGGWAVAATLDTPVGGVDIGTGASPGDTGRRVRINGANARAIEEMSAYLRLLWLTPAMDGLFTGPAGERRRFLDRLVTTLIPSHSSTVNAYETAMRQRNRLLETSDDRAWLSAIERQMAEHAAAAHMARADCLLHLEQLIAQSLDGGAFPAAGLALSPLFEDAREPISSTALEHDLMAVWAAGRALDRAAGRTLVGPHRVDLLVRHAQKNMPAEMGSTGEQKALLIGLVLAHARLVSAMTGLVPLLLLDEVAAHLDPARRAALFAALDSLGTQCFMTGTDPLLFAQLGSAAQYFTVEDGRIAPGAG